MCRLRIAARLVELGKPVIGPAVVRRARERLPELVERLVEPASLQQRGRERLPHRVIPIRRFGIAQLSCSAAAAANFAIALSLSPLACATRASTTFCASASTSSAGMPAAFNASKLPVLARTYLKIADCCRSDINVE